MRVLLLAFAVTSLVARASAQSDSPTYWLLQQNDGNTWCGYRDSTAYMADAARLQPEATVKAVYASGRLVEVTDVVEAESGDWMVIDQYTPSDTGVRLLRRYRFTQADREIDKETVIRHGQAQPFRIVDVTTLARKKAPLDTTYIDFPEVPVERNLSTTPYVVVIDQMRKSSLQRICRKF